MEMNQALFNLNAYLVEFLFRQGMLLLLCIQALAISFSRNRNANRMLSAFFLILFLILFVDKEFLNFIEFYDRELLRRFSWLPALLLPALFYFSILYYMQPQRKFSYKDLLYTAPFLMVFILTLPFPCYYPYDNNNESWRLYVNIYRYLSQGVLITYSLYIWAQSYKLFMEHSVKIKTIYSYSQNVDIKWIRNILFAVPLILLAHITRIYIETPLFYNIGDILLLITIIYMGVNVIIQPEIFSISDWDNSSSDTETETSTTPINVTYDDSKVQELLTLMSERKPYLNQDLNLGDLAFLLDIRPQRLSQIITMDLDSNFYSFINKYRVEYCKELLLNKSTVSLSMEGIAHSAGFKSRTTFYNRFNEFVGLTPKQYIECKSKKGII